METRPAAPVVDPAAPTMEPTPPDPLRIVALDLGERRIGVAVSDPMRLAATPLPTVERAGDQAAVDAIGRILDEWAADICVVGLPLDMDGGEGRQAQRARSFAGRLRKAFPTVRFELFDERLSSFAADQRMEERGLNARKRRELRDALAATVILEDYLRQSGEE